MRNNIKALYEPVVQNSHLLTLPEYQQMSSFMKTKLNEKSRSLFDFDKDIKDKNSEVQLTSTENEELLKLSEVDKELRDKTFKFIIRPLQQEYVVQHLKSNITITFKAMQEHDLESFENVLRDLYQNGPDVVLIDEKPYYRHILNWKHELETNNNILDSFKDPQLRFMDNGQKLKKYLHTLWELKDDYKIGQQDKIIFENNMMSKKPHVGYSLLLNILFVIGQENKDIKTGLIRPTLNEHIHHHVENMTLENAKSFYEFAEHKFYIEKLDYVMNTCVRQHGWPKCNPNKIDNTISDISRIFTDFELDKSFTYKSMASNIHKSTELYGDKLNFSVLIDTSKSCTVTAFLTYIKWYADNVLMQVDDSKETKNESEFSIVNQMRQKVDNQGQEDIASKYLYLRSVFKDDKEHVYALDKILESGEGGEGDRRRDFYQKLCYNLSNGQMLSQWAGMKYDYKWYPVNLFLDKQAKNIYY